MKISVFGLGYVGTVTAACLSSSGHQVVGVDVDRYKVQAINQGKPPIQEPQLDALLLEAKKAGFLEATTDAREAVLATDVSLIAVGTPSAPGGDPDLTALERVRRQLASALREKQGYHCLVIRSTVPPGTTRCFLQSVSRESNKPLGRALGGAMNPEFMREGSAVEDFYSPPFTVIGEYDIRSGDLVAEMYQPLPNSLTQTFRVSLEDAEIIKYASNAFRAMKVAFANELARIAEPHGVNAGKIMDILSSDRRFALGTSHMHPGLPFGGSCFPKDLRALIALASACRIDVPLLRGIMLSNASHKEWIISRITRFGKRRIGILGITFKSGTDDVRESPSVQIARSLIDKGYDVKIYDAKVRDSSQVYGSNKAYLDAHLPEFDSLVVPSIADLVRLSEVIVIGTDDSEYRAVTDYLRPNHAVLDAVGLLKGLRVGINKYEGVSVP